MVAGVVRAEAADVNVLEPHVVARELVGAGEPRHRPRADAAFVADGGRHRAEDAVHVSDRHALQIDRLRAAVDC